MTTDARAVAIIPAYKPTSAVLDVVTEILHSGRFRAVVCVDDGSGAEFSEIFRALELLGVTVLRHYTNLGKGRALQTGINMVAVSYPEAVGAVTLDADGQHLGPDVIAIGGALEANPSSLIMGCRNFSADVPLRSRFGNIVTRKIMKVLTGIEVSDTQTGLRGIPRSLFSSLLKLSTGGYDFEIDMLIRSHALGVEIKEVPIQTVYIDENASSHFRPILDSLAIYFVLVRHTANAIVTAGLDYIAFVAALALGQSIFASMIVGRVIAGSMNFFIGKRLVFRSKGSTSDELLRYTALVVFLMLLSYGAVLFLVDETGLSPYLAKIVVESSIFLLSFSVQRLFVFNSSQDSQKVLETDWDSYYSKRKVASSPTRSITERLVLSLVSKQSLPINHITEFGGGDSCFFSAFRRQYPDASYIVVAPTER